MAVEGHGCKGVSTVGGLLGGRRWSFCTQHISWFSVFIWDLKSHIWEVTVKSGNSQYPQEKLRMVLTDIPVAHTEGISIFSPTGKAQSVSVSFLIPTFNCFPNLPIFFSKKNPFVPLERCSHFNSSCLPKSESPKALSGRPAVCGF